MATKSYSIGNKTSNSKDYTLTINASDINTWVKSNIPQNAYIESVALTCSCKKSALSNRGNIDISVNGTEILSESKVVDSVSDYNVNLNIVNFIQSGNADAGKISGNIVFYFDGPLRKVDWYVNNITIAFKYYIATTKVTPAGAGTVEIMDAGLKNGTRYIAILAEANDGYSFVKWTVSNGWELQITPYTIYIEEDLTITANFQLDKINNIYVDTVKPKAIYFDDSNIVFVVDGTIPTAAASIFDTVDGYHIKVQNTVPSGMTEVKEVYFDTTKVYG